ncbi:MAG TPA: leucyl aminopeptidase [Dictyobacter sp.]|jgi:leucyl aminopeptidase|nr:leucyl aminopeptidase [Dictyobacter sp.]
MEFRVVSQDIQALTADAIVVGAVRTADKSSPVELTSTASSVNSALSGLITDSCANGEFKGSLGELLTLHTTGKLASKRVIVVGLGSSEKITPQLLQRASATAARYAQNTGVHHIALAIDWTSASMNVSQSVQAQVEGTLLGTYTFKKYFSSDAPESTIENVSVVAPTADTALVEKALEKGRILAEATNFARTLVNEPPNVLTPTELANRAKNMANETGLECEIFDKEKITELGMGGLLAVTKGSAEPPQFIILRHKGGNSSDKGLALVGKGITFDTGGISLKPAAGMDEMKGDMGGAAAVLGAMQAIAQLKPDMNVTAFVPTCENRPSSTSFLPGDILRFFNGKTMEIVNTDAEGRLILADGLSYAVSEGHSPVIDLATLTGAIVVGLGTVNTGLYSNNDQLTQDIVSSGYAAGEKYWPMPLDDEYADQIRSDVADIKQTGGREGGSVTAAKILENFVGDANWAHLDIAGTSYLSSKKSHQEKGGTGVGVRMLTELVLKRATRQ